MGLGDFIMLIDKLGIWGILITLIFCSVMFMGSIVDIYQFLWRYRRWNKKRKQAEINKIRALILLEMHDKMEK
jgi:heme/copper-type cytochrome/quinol oxidase subunit 2